MPPGCLAKLGLPSRNFTFETKFKDGDFWITFPPVPMYAFSNFTDYMFTTLPPEGTSDMEAPGLAGRSNTGTHETTLKARTETVISGYRVDFTPNSWLDAESFMTI